jgi:hypothetical protein
LRTADDVGSRGSESEDSTDLDGFVVSDDAPLSTAGSSCGGGNDSYGSGPGRSRKGRKRLRVVMETSDEEDEQVSPSGEERRGKCSTGSSRAGRVDCAARNKRVNTSGVEETLQLLQQARTLLDVACRLVDLASLAARSSNSVECRSGGFSTPLETVSPSVREDVAERGSSTSPRKRRVVSSCRGRSAA